MHLFFINCFTTLCLILYPKTVVSNLQHQKSDLSCSYQTTGEKNQHTRVIWG